MPSLSAAIPAPLSSVAHPYGTGIAVLRAWQRIP